jgi:hypothetical protein
MGQEVSGFKSASIVGISSDPIIWGNWYFSEDFLGHGKKMKTGR